jgi:hypothetical protein
MRLARLVLRFTVASPKGPRSAFSLSLLMFETGQEVRVSPYSALMASSWVLIFNVILSVLFGHAYGGKPLIAQQDWLLPLYPDYTMTFTIGQTHHISWDSDLKNWFSSWGAVCGDPLHVDLWMQTGHDDDSQYKLACKRKNCIPKHPITIAELYQQLELTSTLQGAGHGRSTLRPKAPL